MLHGGVTTAISAGEVHLPGRPTDPAGVKAEVQIFEGESFEITNDICHAGRYGDLTATPAQ
jgi:hypothetical protein